MPDDDREVTMNRSKMGYQDPGNYAESEDSDKAQNTRRDYGRRKKTPSGRSGKGTVRHKKPRHAFRRKGRV
jgi:hypothetical protein